MPTSGNVMPITPIPVNVAAVNVAINKLAVNASRVEEVFRAKNATEKTTIVISSANGAPVCAHENQETISVRVQTTIIIPFL